MTTPSPDNAPTHSKLSPSKAYQWTVCTESIGFAELNAARIPPDVSSPAAIEGTKAHTVGECYLLKRLLPAYANQDMKTYGRHYADLCEEHRGPAQHVYDWGVERRTPLYYLLSERGTVDFFCVNKTGVHLVDLKYGYGRVPSIGNKQMAIYAASLVTEGQKDLLWPEITDATPISMTIFQPRLEEDVIVWTTNWGELRRFVAEEITPHADNIQAPWYRQRKVHTENGVSWYAPDPRVKFDPSEETCKYCPAYTFCDARNKWLLNDFAELAEFAQDGGDLPPFNGITDERLVQIRARKKVLTTWLEEIDSYLDGKVVAGMPVPGLKKVLSNGGHRYWEDKALAGRTLLEMHVPYDEIYTTDIVSPAQAEKLTKNVKGKKQIELHRLMRKPAGTPVVVLESDPRPAHDDNPFASLKETEDWL